MKLKERKKPGPKPGLKVKKKSVCIAIDPRLLQDLRDLSEEKRWSLSSTFDYILRKGIVTELSGPKILIQEEKEKGEKGKANQISSQSSFKKKKRRFIKE